MKVVQVLENYQDEDGNEIVSSRSFEKNVRIEFLGKNNRILVDEHTNFDRLSVSFDGDNGSLRIGANAIKRSSMWNIRVGEDSVVEIGDGVSTTATCVISAVEGTNISIGNDVMIASGVQLRADDGHAIYDVATKKRVNHSRSITISDHVWLAFEVVVLAGASVGEGSVVGFRSIVTKVIPNNCIAVGSPAKVVRKNIAWERPHLSRSRPAYRPDASAITPTSKYWNLTTDAELQPAPVILSKVRPSVYRRLRRKLGKLRNQFLQRLRK